MSIKFVVSLVISLALNSSALADAADQGCQSSGNNANGCLGSIFAAPAPLAEGGIILVAIGLAVFLRNRGGKDK
jgi:hypothetical protein